MEGTDEPNILAAEKRGYASLARALGEADRVAVWVYHEEGVDPVVGWGAPSAAVAPVEAITPGEPKTFEAPRFYDAIGVVLKDIAARADSLPRRRVLVLMSDAKDAGLEEPAETRAKLDALAALAASAGVTIHALGFTMDVAEPLANLKSLAERSGGGYRDISSADTEQALAAEIAAQAELIAAPRP